MRSKGNTDITKTTQESQHKFDLIPKNNTLSQKCDPKAIQIYKKQHMKTYTNSFPLNRDNTLS
jgi:hypothetical protein